MNCRVTGKALQLLYDVIEDAPGAIILRYKLGLARLNPPFVQLEEAAANMLLVCQQMPEYDEAHQLFGLAMARRGNVRIAHASLMEALRLNPNNAGARMTLAQIQPMLGAQPANLPLPIPLLEIYPSLTPRRLAQVRYDANGRSVPDGIEVEWHENGRLKRFQDFDMGVRHGLDLTLDAEGRLLSRTAYQDGKRLNLGAGQ